MSLPGTFDTLPNAGTASATTATFLYSFTSLLTLSFTSVVTSNFCVIFGTGLGNTCNQFGI